MDYEKKLALAKEALDSGSYDKETIEYIFPELKESEDERIRKDIIRYIKKTSPAMGENIEHMIAWLEKQGETYTKKDIDNAYLEGMVFAKDELEKQNKQILANSAKTCKDEQQPTDNDIKELLHTEYEKGRADAIAEMQKPVDCTDCTNSKGCINCEDGNMKETLVQNLAWSEEDEEFLRRAINATKDVYPMTAKWLKFLKDRVQPQPKQEWSEEDKGNLLDVKCIIDKVWHSKDFREDTHYSTEELESLWSWLDDIWQRVEYPHDAWKPSDEQLEALKNAIHLKPFENPSDSILWGLYEQLKKL